MTPPTTTPWALYQLSACIKANLFDLYVIHRILRMYEAEGHS